MRHPSRLTKDYGKSELQGIRKCPGWENKIKWKPPSWKRGIYVSTNPTKVLVALWEFDIIVSNK